MDTERISRCSEVVLDGGSEGLRKEFGVDIGFGSGEPPNVQSAESALTDNLLWIKACPRARVLEEHWEKTISLFESRIDRKSRQIRTVREEILQLIAFNGVFQGVLFSCVAQSNVLQCRNLWTPISLSALASIVTLGGVTAKYRTIESLEGALRAESETLQVVVKRIYKLRREGPKYDFSDHGNDFPRIRTRRAVRVNFVVLSLVASFSVIILVSFWHILCKS